MTRLEREFKAAFAAAVEGLPLVDAPPRRPEMTSTATMMGVGRTVQEATQHWRRAIDHVLEQQQAVVGDPWVWITEAPEATVSLLHPVPGGSPAVVGGYWYHCWVNVRVPGVAPPEIRGKQQVGRR